MAAMLKCHNKKVAKSIVADFICYMLDNSRQGIPRYTLYDPKKYPNTPYYKWLISQVRFFYMDYCEAEQKYSSKNVSLVENLPDDEGFVPNTLSMNSLIGGVENTDPFYKASADFTIDYIKNLADGYNDTDVKMCFESESYDLLTAKLNDISVSKFARSKGVSLNEANKWFDNLKTLIKELYNGEEPSFG